MCAIVLPLSSVDVLARWRLSNRDKQHASAPGRLDYSGFEF